MDSGVANNNSNVSWQTPSVRKTSKRHLSSPNIYVNKASYSGNAVNKFSVLDVSSDEEQQNNTSEDDNEKPPPIIIPNVGDIKSMIKSFSDQIKQDNFSYKSLRDGQIRLMVKNIPCYRKIVKFLDNNNLAYHTYQLKKERSYRVVVKKLHYSTPIDELKTEIESKGHKVRNITNIKTRNHREPLPMFFVDLEPSQNNKDIYEITRLYNCVVKIEPPLKTDDIVQCHRCQQFGHTKTYCRNTFICVKCGLNHPTKVCPKPPNANPKCANCLESHAASYKGCEVYRKIVQKQKDNRGQYAKVNDNDYNYRSQHVPVLNNSNFSNNYRSNNLSYAQAAGSQQENNTLKNIEILIQKQTEITTTLLNMMQLILTKLCH